MHPKELRIKDYTYKLPQYQIAKFPLQERDASNLLCYEKGNISDYQFRDLPQVLPPDSFLIFNNTRVVQARLRFETENGKHIEVFCLEPAEEYRDFSIALAETGGVNWVCMIGGNRKWKSGVHEMNFTMAGTNTTLKIERKENLGGVFLVRFDWEPAEVSFAEILDHAGVTPLPPYLKREADENDKTRYQTIYAQFEGSVAAPTAGLHFTEDVMKSLREREIIMEEVTLHVGAGTFKPVSSEKLADHEMHYEFIDVSVNFLNSLSQNIEKTIIAVGTTSIRTIESLYWMGVKTMGSEENLSPADLEINQWYPYETKSTPPAAEALKALADNMEKQGLDRLITRTQLMIAPPYKPKVAHGLITNYHQPKSTLLLLVAALVGNDWKQIYDHALENEYRFLSYGDSSLLMF